MIPRRQLRRPVLLGLVVALLSSLPACGFLGGGGTYTLTAHFPRAVSVFPSSDVRILGLPAGEVTDVAIDGDRVLVVMAIPDDIRVPADATAQIVPQSLIGERYIQLSPAYRDGMPAAEDGDEIERTIVPVEPDEALAALKEFLDSLDPEGLGTLIGNLEEDLRGHGQGLNDALGSLSHLVETFAGHDDVLVRIVESFDRLTATLVTREAQLGEVLDAFAEASQVLADERDSISELVAGLSDLSQTGLRLVGKHSAQLRTDIETLADAAATIDANLTSVTQLLEAGGLLTTGLLDAYNPELRAIDLRNNFGPLVPELANLLLDQLGLPPICIDVLIDCTVFEGQAGRGAPVLVEAAPTPIGSLLDLLREGTR